MKARPGFHQRRVAMPMQPGRARAQWISMLELAAVVGGEPEGDALHLANAVRGLNADNFPGERGDVWRVHAKAFLALVGSFVRLSPHGRKSWARSVLGGAQDLLDHLRELGAAEAQAARGRMGMED